MEGVVWNIYAYQVCFLPSSQKNKRLKIKGGGTGVGFGCKLVKVNLEHADRRPHSNGVSHYTALRHPSVVSGFRLPQCIQSLLAMALASLRLHCAHSPTQDQLFGCTLIICSSDNVAASSTWGHSIETSQHLPLKQHTRLAPSSRHTRTFQLKTPPQNGGTGLVLKQTQLVGQLASSITVGVLILAIINTPTRKKNYNITVTLEQAPTPSVEPPQTHHHLPRLTVTAKHALH